MPIVLSRELPTLCEKISLNLTFVRELTLSNVAVVPIADRYPSCHAEKLK